MIGKKPIYHLNLTMSGCLARVTLNGFPVISTDARRPLGLAPPVNAFLAGEGNVLSITALPVPGGIPNPLKVDVRGSLAAFQDGDIVAPGGGGEPIQLVDLRASLAGKKLEFPLHVSYVFDNEGPAFPALFRESEIIDGEDPAPLVAYAMTLKRLAAASDASGLAAELAPKMRDYAAAYYDTEESMMGELSAFLQGSMFPGPMDLEFEEGDILPVPCCEGRIWELRRAPGRPLLSTLPDAKGGRFQIPVYVARVGGALKVVR